MRVSSSLHSIHHLSSPHSWFTHFSGSCLKLPPWLALKVTGRPQPSGSEKPGGSTPRGKLFQPLLVKISRQRQDPAMREIIFIIYLFHFFSLHHLQMQHNAVPCSSVHHKTMRSNHSPLSAPPGRQGEQRLTGLNAPISHVFFLSLA